MLRPERTANINILFGIQEAKRKLSRFYAVLLINSKPIKKGKHRTSVVVSHNNIQKCHKTSIGHNKMGKKWCTYWNSMSLHSPREIKCIRYTLWCKRNAQSHEKVNFHIIEIPFEVFLNCIELNNKYWGNSIVWKCECYTTKLVFTRR